MKSEVIAVYSHFYFPMAQLRDMVNDSFDYFWWACYHDEVKEQYCYIVQVSNSIRTQGFRPCCTVLPHSLIKDMELIHWIEDGERQLKFKRVYEYNTVYAYGLKSAEMIFHYYGIVHKINKVVGFNVREEWKTASYEPHVAKRLKELRS